MKSILLLVIEFAPYQTAGAYRTIFFTKYLEQFGIQPIVLTVEPDKKNVEFQKNLNYSMNNLLGDKTIIYRLKLEDMSYSTNYYKSKLQQYFKIQDRYTRFWRTSVLEEVPKIIKKHNPIAVYTSLPFFSQADLAIDLSKKFELPLVLDLRDNWSHWVISPYATFIHYYLTKRKEKKAFKAASQIITVTEELKQIFLNTNSFLKNDEITVIPNGFDDDLIEPYHSTFNDTGQEKIIFTYIGSYYYVPEKHKDMFSPWYKKKGHKMLQYTPVKENWLYRSPFFILECLKELFAINPLLKNRIRFQHVGISPNWLNKMFLDFGLEDILIEKGIVPKEDLDKILIESDFCLTTSVKVEGGKDYAIASKTFDYLKQKRPILSFSTEGAQSEFIRKSNTGIVFDPDKPQQNARAILNLLNDGISLKINEEYLSSFHRKKTAKQLANEIFKVIAK